MTARVAILQNRMAVDGRSRYIGETIIALNELGVEPVLHTLSSRARVEDWTARQFAGRSPRFRLVTDRTPPLLRGYIHETLWHNWAASRSLRDLDLVISGNDTLAFLPSPPVRINVVHFPLRAVFTTTPRHRRWTWRVLGLPARLAATAFDRPPAPGDLTLPNSRYTARFTAEVWPGAPLELVYPPVSMGTFDPTTPRDVDVLSLGTFSPDKQQLEQVDLAARLPHLSFVMVGSTASARYVRAVRQRIHALGAHNVRLVENASEEQTDDLLGRSRVFLHLKVGEHFGISVAQAIARGCVPVVSDSGGLPEIVPVPSLRFASMAELPDLIARAVDGPLVTPRQLDELRAHVRRFADHVFRARMKEIIAPRLVAFERRPAPARATA